MKRFVLLLLACSAANELHFIEENGRAVIDDIVRTGDAGSLKTELQGIASQGAGAQ